MILLAITTWKVTLLLVFLFLIVLPVASYMIMKFGAAGYFRAKQREREKTNKLCDQKAKNVD